MTNKKDEWILIATVSPGFDPEELIPFLRERQVDEVREFPVSKDKSTFQWKGVISWPPFHETVNPAMAGTTTDIQFHSPADAKEAEEIMNRLWKDTPS